MCILSSFFNCIRSAQLVLAILNKNVESFHSNVSSLSGFFVNNIDVCSFQLQCFRINLNTFLYFETEKDGQWKMLNRSYFNKSSWSFKNKLKTVQSKFDVRLKILWINTVNFSISLQIFVWKSFHFINFTICSVVVKTATFIYT